MKIALFTDAYVPISNGVVTHVKSLKNGLEKLGHEVLVVCAYPKPGKHRFEGKILYCPSISFKKFCNCGVAVPISLVRFKYVKRFNPDIIHIHTEFSIGYFGALVAKLLKKPLIYTLHTIYDEYLYYIAPKKLINLAKKASHVYGGLLAEKATCITGPSKKVVKYFENCGVKKTIHVISNPVELDIFNYENFDINQILKTRQNLGINQGEILVCFCGRLGFEKSVDVLLQFWSKAVKDDRCYKLLIIGDGPCKCSLKNYSKELGLKGQVLFIGNIPHKKLPLLYSSCDMYITASLSDTNSISMLEAMACGLPVFHLYDELNRDQIINNVNGFFYRDEYELKSLFYMFKNMTRLKKETLKENTRKSVLKFGDVNLAQNLLKVYNKSIAINCLKHSKTLKFNIKSRFKFRRD